MREILFRGKRVDNGEWIYGYYIKATHHWHNHGIHEDWIATDTVQNGGWCNVRGKYAVITDTIGQFTGLYDENNKRIFEGDVVIIEFAETTVKGSVLYIGASFYIATESDLLEIDNYCYIKVIGNIYDGEHMEGANNEQAEKGRLVEMKNNSWIYDRLPTEEENENGLVGIVNGYNGKIRFTDAVIFVNYDFDSKEWWSLDYNLTDCKVECWFPVPAYHPTEKGGVEE